MGTTYASQPYRHHEYRHDFAWTSPPISLRLHPEEEAANLDPSYWRANRVYNTTARYEIVNYVYRDRNNKQNTILSGLRDELSSFICFS